MSRLTARDTFARLARQGFPGCTRAFAELFATTVAEKTNLPPGALPRHVSAKQKRRERASLTEVIAKLEQVA